ncbi:MAG: hypothetical protein ACRDFB_09260 [Rhabdochlamydiaceae bacterium]
MNRLQYRGYIGKKKHEGRIYYYLTQKGRDAVYILEEPDWRPNEVIPEDYYT